MSYAQKIRWGIIGPGTIAQKFASALNRLEEAECVGVASKTPGRAEAFAKEFAFKKTYSSYEALAEDDEIDVVYIATTHPHHANPTKICLNHGKAVLCEKPMTSGAKYTKELIDLAREKKLFLMEAIWTRFLPIMVELRKRIQTGELGEIRSLHADFGIISNQGPEGRMFNPDLAGGALLDLGIYPLSVASMVFGKPVSVKSQAFIGATGVDELNSTILGYKNGAMALLGSGSRATTAREMTVSGTKAWVKVHHPFWNPRVMTLYDESQELEEIHIPCEGNGYEFEAMEVMNCMRSGLLESAIMPLDETFELAKTMDECRRQWGMTYPWENKNE